MLSTHKGDADGAGEFPSRVSLIIPSDAFNSSAMFRGERPPPLVEVTCAVVDIWPVWPVGDPQRVAG